MSRKTEGDKPKIAVIGFTGVGKTTVANIFAELTGGKAIGTYDLIRADYCQIVGIREETVRENKDTFRPQLYEHGNLVKKKDPAAWAKRAIEQGANVVAGFRDPYEFKGARCLFNHVVWVHRPGFHPKDTDHLDSGYGEDIIRNTDIGPEWWDSLVDECRWALAGWDVEVEA